MPDINSRFTPEPMQLFPGASLTDAYQQFKDSGAVATTLQNPSRCLVFVNNTGMLLYISWNGTDDHLPLAAGATVVLDENSNAVPQSVFVSPKGTAFYVRQPANTAGSDNVYLSTFYAS